MSGGKPVTDEGRAKAWIADWHRRWNADERWDDAASLAAEFQKVREECAAVAGCGTTCGSPHGCVYECHPNIAAAIRALGRGTVKP